MKSIVSSYRFYSTVVLSLEVIHPSLPGTAGTGGQVVASLSRICAFSFYIYICMSSCHVINDNLSICCPPFSF